MKIRINAKNDLNETILKFRKEFEINKYSLQNSCHTIDQLLQAKNQIPVNWNPHQSHEFLKLMVRSKTLELRTMNKRENSSSNYHTQNL